MMTVSPRVSRMPLTRSSACSDPDVIRISPAIAVDAGGALELLRQEFAQPPVAERAAVQAIGRERRAFARQHVVRGFDQSLDRNMIGIVVAADEIVFGKAVPFDGGGGRPGASSGVKSNAELSAFMRLFPSVSLPAGRVVQISKSAAIRVPQTGWRNGCTCYCPDRSFALSIALPTLTEEAPYAPLLARFAR